MSDGSVLPQRTVRWVLVGVSVVVVAGLALVAWSGVRPGTSAGQSPAPTTDLSVPASAGTVSSAEPSPAEPRPCSQDDPCADSPLPVAPGAEVAVLVTSSGWDQARGVAWVAADVGVLDPSGTCTATLRRGQTQVVQEASAEPGPMTTSCAVEVDGGRLGAGEWLVGLSYVSGQHSGTAAEVSIKIP
ncbi:MAG: hypothetical protein FWH11_04220 [Micrococcales bacterium]|nr:hypothetical protein [Micrococcales bacterium]